MTLIDYVKKYGNFDFNEEEFNDVDNVIFSLVSYVDFKGIVPKGDKEITLEEAANIFFRENTKKDISKKIFSIKSAINLFKLIKDYKRYKNVKLYNYVYECNREKQFSAVTIRIKEDLIYVSYEGTDEFISGWKEDFELSYLYPIPSHIDAVEYLNKTIKFKDKNVIVGGHSKGGNLALISAMNCNILVRGKIKKVYSNDGPGILEEEIHSRRYKKVKSKYIHIIPKYSIVGILLENANDEIISSSKKGILAHDALNWEVEDNHFVCSKLDESSIRLKGIFDDWLDNYNFEQRMMCVNELFEIFDRNNINTLNDFKSKGLSFILSIIKDNKEIEDQAKIMFKELFTLIFNDYTSRIKERIKIGQ